MHRNEPISVAIVGARGYSGLELARILLKHPGVKLGACFATDSEWKLSDYLADAGAETVPVCSMSDLERLAPSFQTVFLATPNEVSLEWAPKLLNAGTQVIDLSGAFRLKSSPVAAQYGLVPWAEPSELKLVANPGCYATSVLMAVIPLLKERLIDPASLVIDAKSGTSGAGRKAEEGLLFTEVEGECLPYRVGKHQHLPEISQFAEKFSGVAVDPLFTTHLLPVRRGIISGLYARLAPGITQAAVAEAYERAYRDYSLVRLAPIAPKKTPNLSLKRVVGSARTQISFHAEGNKLYVFSLIDNLLKGAASQAIENFNRRWDFPVATALAEKEGVL